MDKARAQIIHKLVEDMRTSERKERTALVRRAALALGLNPKSVYRLLREAGWESGRKTRRDAGQSAVDEDLALAVGGLVKQATRANGKRTLTIEGTRRLLEAQGYGVADAETGEITMPSSKTLSTVMRRLGCHPDQVARGKATGRLRSLHPNHAWQVDSSVCVLFYLPGGKKMRLMDETLYNAKKPGRLVEIGRQRVIRYVVTDHCTHSLYVRYDQAAGEDAAGVLTTLIEAMSDRGPRDPMHGVPSILYMDKSGGNQSSLIRNFCATLGITLHYHAAGNAPATGSVEVAQNIVEREFESRLRFADVRDLEQLQEMADRWRRHYNAHAVHRRLACTRNAAWLRITPEQLRVTDRETLTAVAQWGEQTRRVRHDYTISVNTRSHGTHTYDLRTLALHGIHVRDEVTVVLNPFNAPEIVVSKTMPDGTELRFNVAPMQRDENGFDMDAPVIGQEWGTAVETPVDRATAKMDELARTDGEQARPWSHIDPMADVREAPLHLRREGTPLQMEAREAPAVPLTRAQAAQRLRSLDAAPWEEDAPACMAWLRETYGDTVPEEALPVIRETLRKRMALREVKPAEAPARRLAFSPANAKEARTCSA